MANAFNVHAIVANMALWFLKNELVMGNKVHRGFEREWRTINGHKQGEDISIDRPVRFKAIDGPDITGQIQDVVYGKTTLPLNIQKTVPFEISTRDMTTEADVRRVNGEAVKAAVSEIAEEVETHLTGLYKQVANFHGTPGTLPTNTKTIGQGGTIMTNLGVPRSRRCTVLEPDAKLEIADKVTNLYHENKVKNALERSRLGPIHNFDCYESASLLTHTCGDWTGTILINGADQVVGYNEDVSTGRPKDTWFQDIAIDGFGGATTVKAGDVINIAGVYEVNPGTHKSTGRLRDFVVVNDTTASGGAIAALRITPPMIPVDSSDVLDKAHATVNTAPADNAGITVRTGAAGEEHRQNLQFHKNAFALVMKPLQKLDGFHVWEQRSHEGLSITLSRDVDIKTHTEICRLDALFGVKCIQPELAARLTS